MWICIRNDGPFVETDGFWSKNDDFNGNGQEANTTISNIYMDVVAYGPVRFLLKNLDFLSKIVDFWLKNVDFITGTNP